MQRNEPQDAVWELPNQGAIYTLEEAAAFIKMVRTGLPRPTIILTSCPADLLHSGHVTAIQDSLKKVEELLPRNQWGAGSYLFVVINDDEFLVRKKGAALLPHKVRCQVVSALRGVDAVIAFYPSDPTDNTVNEALRVLRPDFFTKGGDRTFGSTPEFKTCEELGIRIVVGCGDAKTQSSSAYLKVWGDREYRLGYAAGRREGIYTSNLPTS